MMTTEAQRTLRGFYNSIYFHCVLCFSVFQILYVLRIQCFLCDLCAFVVQKGPRSVFRMNLSNIVKEEGMQFAYPWQDMQEESDNKGIIAVICP